jgi:hypothetical protein
VRRQRAGSRQPADRDRRRRQSRPRRQQLRGFSRRGGFRR